MRRRGGGSRPSFGGPAGGYPAEMPGIRGPLPQQQISAFWGSEERLAYCFLLP